MNAISWNTTCPRSTARLSKTSGGIGFGRELDALGARLVEHRRKEAHLELEGEHVGADVEWRVDIDQLQPAGLLDLLAQRAALQARQDQLVVAPDQLVGPALDLPPARVEEFGLRRGPRLGPRLVDVLQRLERQHRRAHVARLAVPHQLDLPLVLEQDEAVSLGQWPAGLDQRDQVALLGVGEVYRGVGAGGHVQQPISEPALRRSSR